MRFEPLTLVLIAVVVAVLALVIFPFLPALGATVGMLAASALIVAVLIVGGVLGLLFLLRYLGGAPV